MDTDAPGMNPLPAMLRVALAFTLMAFGATLSTASAALLTLTADVSGALLTSPSLTISWAT
jgi:hypothetical protein